MGTWKKSPRVLAGALNLIALMRSASSGHGRKGLISRDFAFWAVCRRSSSARRTRQPDRVARAPIKQPGGIGGLEEHIS
jgi:hypothetical protein